MIMFFPPTTLGCIDAGLKRLGFNQIGRFTSTSEEEIRGQGSGGCMQIIYIDFKLLAV